MKKVNWMLWSAVALIFLIVIAGCNENKKTADSSGLNEAFPNEQVTTPPPQQTPPVNSAPQAEGILFCLIDANNQHLPALAIESYSDPYVVPNKDGGWNWLLPMGTIVNDNFGFLDDGATLFFTEEFLTKTMKATLPVMLKGGRSNKWQPQPATKGTFKGKTAYLWK
jgi:hypothetical protein